MRLDEGRALNPGLLRHRITWQRKTEGAQNTYGEPSETWDDVLACACQIKAMSGRELDAARQRWAEATYVIRQHYYAGLLPTDRIAWYVDGATKYLDVLSIEDRDGIGRTQTVVAKERL